MNNICHYENDVLVGCRHMEEFIGRMVKSSTIYKETIEKYRNGFIFDENCICPHCNALLMKEPTYRALTKHHIQTVQKNIHLATNKLIARGALHDISKLEAEEATLFKEYGNKLKTTEYGSSEYKALLEKMDPALKHHYENNKHHPEYHEGFACDNCHMQYKEKPKYCIGCDNVIFHKVPGILRMSLIDLLEMVCDWKAAADRHDNGDIWKSLKINAKRFQIPQYLQLIIENTVRELF